MEKNRKKIEEIIRVNHAGEYGARRIYEGQLSVFKDKSISKLIHDMKSQEEEHLIFFEEQLTKNHIRPSILGPIWNIGGYMLGKITALMGEKAAMACTEAVEEVIVEHYQSQIQELEDCELRYKIIEFKNDELVHHSTAIENNSHEAPLYKIMTNIIKVFCKVSVKLAQKF